MEINYHILVCGTGIGWSALDGKLGEPESNSGCCGKDNTFSTLLPEIGLDSCSQ
jgi:hypothetical protein